ncbi:MAG TPA: NAD-binding protein [Ktedonobacterales bacterium]|jgi:Trk K+ transport system NAD-binding subunit/nucleotide-binding universal stress UspA family protein
MSHVERLATVTHSAAIGENHRRRVLIAGAGRTGRRLAERLIEHWSVILLDTRQEGLEAAHQALALSPISSPSPPSLSDVADRLDRLICVTGDATSRLALERAGAGDIDCLVATCSDDVTNLEICRLARDHFSVSLLAAVVREADLLPQFQALGVQTVLMDTSLAVALANRIEPAFQVSEELGLGHGELMELTIPASSPVLGRPLRAFAADHWLIAAVYRQGRLIIPHGQTRLQEHDHILLVGSPLLLPGVADYLRLGRAQFPYPYGARLAVVLEKSSQAAYTAIHEARALAEHSAAEEMDFLVWGDEKRWKQWEERLVKLLEVPQEGLSKPFFYRSPDVLSQQWGCLVVPPQRSGWSRRFGWRRTLLDDALAYTHKPVLIARSSAPYRQVAALIQGNGAETGEAGSLRALRAALAVGSALKLEVRALAVTAPAFIAGEMITTTRQEIDQAMLTLAATYHMRVERQHLTGNPIREVQARLDPHDLLVVRVPRRVRASFFRPDVGRYLALRASCSVLVVPDE